MQSTNSSQLIMKLCSTDVEFMQMSKLPLVNTQLMFNQDEFRSLVNHQRITKVNLAQQSKNEIDIERHWRSRGQRLLLIDVNQGLNWIGRVTKVSLMAISKITLIIFFSCDEQLGMRRRWFRSVDAQKEVTVRHGRARRRRRHANFLKCRRPFCFHAAGILCLDGSRPILVLRVALISF